MEEAIIDEPTTIEVDAADAAGEADAANAAWSEVSVDVLDVDGMFDAMQEDEDALGFIKVLVMDGCEVFVEEVHVAERGRGQCISFIMFERLTEYLLRYRQAAHRLRLEVALDNNGAISMYRRLGFRKNNVCAGNSPLDDNMFMTTPVASLQTKIKQLKQAKSERALQGKSPWSTLPCAVYNGLNLLDATYEPEPEEINDELGGDSSDGDDDGPSESDGATDVREALRCLLLKRLRAQIVLLRSVTRKVGIKPYMPSPYIHSLRPTSKACWSSSLTCKIEGPAWISFSSCHLARSRWKSTHHPQAPATHFSTTLMLSSTKSRITMALWKRITRSPRGASTLEPEKRVRMNETQRPRILPGRVLPAASAAAQRAAEMCSQFRSEREPEIRNRYSGH